MMKKSRSIWMSLVLFSFMVSLSACKKDETPIPNFSIMNNNCFSPCIISFTNVSLGTNLSYQWDFGDGGASLEENPSYEYTQHGYWTVTLNVTNNAGFAQIKKEVIVY